MPFVLDSDITSSWSYARLHNYNTVEQCANSLFEMDAVEAFLTSVAQGSHNVVQLKYFATGLYASTGEGWHHFGEHFPAEAAVVERVTSVCARMIHLAQSASPVKAKHVRQDRHSLGAIPLSALPSRDPHLSGTTTQRRIRPLDLPEETPHKVAIRNIHNIAASAQPLPTFLQLTPERRNSR